MKRLQFLSILSVLLILVLIGTAGYHWLEGWNYLDSLYMTIIILSTVGLGEFRNLDHAGKIFTITLICFGAAFAGYALNILGQRLLESQFGSFLSRRKMEKETEKIEPSFYCMWSWKSGDPCNTGAESRKMLRL